MKVRGHILDNRWVVPYNPYLVAKFDCHINVEICPTIKAVKSIYIYKDHDRISLHVISQDSSADVNEIETFQSTSWISPLEVMWRIYGFVLSEIYPTVMSLQLHLEDQQLNSFRKYDNLARITNDDSSSRTMLTEYFRMNQTNKEA